MPDTCKSGYGLPISENMFGKMRGRFDEQAALAIQRDMVNDLVAKFMALPDGAKFTLSALIEKQFENSATGKWSLTFSGINSKQELRYEQE